MRGLWWCPVAVLVVLGVLWFIQWQAHRWDLCACGHARLAHEHLRRGNCAATDCGCTAFRPRPGRHAS